MQNVFGPQKSVAAPVVKCEGKPETKTNYVCPIIDKSRLQLAIDATFPA